MPKKTAPVLIPDTLDLTEEETALVDAWLTSSRAAKAAARIHKSFEDSMITLVQKRKVIAKDGAVIRLGESVSYDYPAEIDALDALSRALKKRAKKDDTATAQSEPCVTVEDLRAGPDADPPPVADKSVLAGLKTWLASIFKHPDA